jgi:hypothetical protein
MGALLERHLKDLKFSEVARGLRALSAGYVENRVEGGLDRIFDGRGKRAAFASYYGAVHFLATAEAVGTLGFALGRSGNREASILDLGCGTGVCGSAWAVASTPRAAVTGVDRSPFALHEARWTYRFLGLRGTTETSIDAGFEACPRPDAVMLGWTLNELDDEVRRRIGNTVAPMVKRGARLLVIEPVSKRVAPWWDEWCEPFVAMGARRAELWLRVPLSKELTLLGKSAGLTPGSVVVRVLSS